MYNDVRLGWSGFYGGGPALSAAINAVKQHEEIKASFNWAKLILYLGVDGKTRILSKAEALKMLGETPEAKSAYAKMIYPLNAPGELFFDTDTGLIGLWGKPEPNGGWVMGSGKATYDLLKGLEGEGTLVTIPGSVFREFPKTSEQTSKAKWISNLYAGVVGTIAGIATVNPAVGAGLAAWIKGSITYTETKGDLRQTLTQAVLAAAQAYGGSSLGIGLINAAGSGAGTATTAGTATATTTTTTSQAGTELAIAAQQSGNLSPTAGYLATQMAQTGMAIPSTAVLETMAATVNTNLISGATSFSAAINQAGGLEALTTNAQSTVTKGIQSVKEALPTAENKAQLTVKEIADKIKSTLKTVSSIQEITNMVKGAQLNNPPGTTADVLATQVADDMYATGKVKGLSSASLFGNKEITSLVIVSGLAAVLFALISRFKK